MPENRLCFAFIVLTATAILFPRHASAEEVQRFSGTGKSQTKLFNLPLGTYRFTVMNLGKNEMAANLCDPKGTKVKEIAKLERGPTTVNTAIDLKQSEDFRIEVISTEAWTISVSRLTQGSPVKEQKASLATEPWPFKTAIPAGFSLDQVCDFKAGAPFWVLRMEEQHTHVIHFIVVVKGPGIPGKDTLDKVQQVALCASEVSADAKPGSTKGSPEFWVGMTRDKGYWVTLETVASQPKAAGPGKKQEPVPVARVLTAATNAGKANPLLMVAVAKRYPIPTGRDPSTRLPGESPLSKKEALDALVDKARSLCDQLAREGVASAAPAATTK